jgi:MinD-like ATPase involved in chromosome partitioning or flagellar assembly
MEKIYVIAAMEDIQYQEAVFAYIQESDYRNKLIIRFCSTRGRVEDMLQSGEPAHIVLATAELMPQIHKEGMEKCAFILLMEDSGHETLEPALNMFQPLHSLFEQALEFYAKLNPNASQKFKRDRKTMIASFYSSIGGSGKTAAALAAAHQLSQRRFNVLYLNMEAVCGNPLHQPGKEEEGVSNLLYYMRNNEKQLPARLEGLRKHSSSLQIDYITGPSNVRDLLELTETDAKRLLQVLAETGRYDYIIVDMDCSVHERNLGILQESDYVYWMMQRNDQCIVKTHVALKFLQKANLGETRFFNQLFFVMNKQLDEQGLSDEVITISAALPYIPEWKNISGISAYSENRHFNHYVRQMLAASRLLAL